MFVLLSDNAHFAFRSSPFQGAIWCFSASEIGHFAWRNGAFRKTTKCPSNINHWYSIFYINLLFFAYLRPKESLFANTRLFFGVYQQKETEKSKSGYNLKVAHIGLISVSENNAVSGAKLWFMAETRILWISVDLRLCRRCFFVWQVR